jgi:hypothetical protein
VCFCNVRCWFTTRFQLELTAMYALSTSDILPVLSAFMPLAAILDMPTLGPAPLKISSTL